MPNVFDITAPNGKTYRMEANDGVSEQDALATFQSLPETEWQAYEYNPTSVPMTAPAPTPAQQAAAPAVPPTEGFKELTAWDVPREQQVLTKSLEEIPGAREALEGLWQQGERRPEAFNAVLEQFGTPSRLTPADIAAGQQREAYYRQRGQNVGIFGAVNRETGIADTQRPDTLTGTAVEAGKRSMANMANSMIGLAGLGAEAVGFEDTADSLLQTYIDKQAAISYEYGQSLQTDDIEDISSFGRYLADTLGELAPQMAGSMGLGSLGSMAATRAARKAAADAVEARVQQGIARDIAEREVATAIRRKAIQGATAGAMLNTTAQEAGSTFAQTYMETGVKAPAMSLVAGVASGSLDAILPVRTLMGFGGPALTNEFKRTFMERLVKEGGRDFVIEGATEAMQEFITSLPTAVINGESPFTAEMLKQMIEAGIKGGIGGGAVGTVTATMQQTAQNLQDARSPRLNEQFPTGSTIVAPTQTNRRTKEFKQQLETATNQVQAIADNITSQWTNAPTEVSALPNFVREQGIDNNAIGVYTEDGRVLINTEAVIKQAERRGVSPDAMVASVVFHESLGHHGLTQQFGAQLDEMLDTIYERGSPELRDRIDSWIAKNPSAYLEADPNGVYSQDNYQRIRAAEEVLAEMSEREGAIERTLYDRIADMIKTFARQMGFDWNYSTREVRSILAVAQRNVMQGDPNGNTPGSVRNMIVYHGSPHTFAPTKNNPLGEFDHSRMGSGEGQQVFGWGTYLTADRKIAENQYRDRLSDIRTSFGGVAGPIWQMREIAEGQAIREGLDGSLADQAFTVRQVIGKNATAEDLWFEVSSLEGWNAFEDVAFNDLPQNWKDHLQKHMKFINDNYKTESSGKVYEVDIPDDAVWLDWNRPLSEQPKLREALEEEGFFVLSREELNQIESRQKEIVRELRDPDLTGPKEKELDTEFDELEKRLRNTFKDTHDGSDIYKRLEDRFRSDRAASEWLASKGFTGNRYLANNIQGNKVPKMDGTDTFNYVIFDDKTPKIVNRYMRGDSPANDNTNSSPGKKAAKYRQDAKESRQKALKYRKKGQYEKANNWDRQAEKEEELAASFAKAALNRPNTYMRGDSPIDPEQLTAEDLVESENALRLLERAAELYTPTQMSIEAVEQDVLARGVSPSDVTRLVRTQPGKLAQKVFMYDVAAEKLQARMLNIEEAIANDGLTPERQAQYIQTQATLDELFNNIFDFQAEIGRTLNFMRRANFTRKRMALTTEGLREMLGKDGIAALADPETFLRFMRANQEKREAAKANKNKPVFGESVLQYTGVPRALMSSFDLSAPMRQGITFIGNKEYWTSFFTMFKMLGKSGRTNYDYLMKEIARHPNYPLMLKARLAFSELDGSLSTREEQFQTDVAREIPIIGEGVAQSEQAYAGFLNKLRADMFNKLVDQYKDADGNIDDKLLTDIGKLVNSGTGRAELPGPLKSAAPQLNALFFSSRLIQSRFNMLNPVFYARLEKPVRMRALAEMGKMGTVMTAVGYLLTLIPGMFGDEEEKVDVELDPRSTDFLKIKVDNTRFDIGGGFNQYLTFGARTALWAGNAVFGTAMPEEKTTSGNYKKYGGDGKFDKDYADEIYRFFRNKLAPNASYVVDAWHGSDSIGQEFDAVGSALSRLVPMFIDDLVENTKEMGIAQGVRYSVPGIFGVGVSTYPDRATDPKQKIDALKQFKDKTAEDGENEWAQVVNGDVFLKPETQVKYEATVNNYFRGLVNLYTGETGKAWDSLSDDEKKEIIDDAKKEARKLAKEDIEELIFND